MPIRNPFAKREVQTGLAPPYEGGVQSSSQNGTRPSFEKVDTMGSKASSAMSISSRKSQEPVEYKMSGMRKNPWMGLLCKASADGLIVFWHSCQ